MKMKKSGMILVLILVLFLVGIFLFNSNQNKTELEEVSLRLAWLHGSGFEGYYVAKEKGYYQEEGLEININPGGLDQNSIKLVASGSDTFGLAGQVEVISARDKGIPVKGVAAFYKNNPIVYFSKESKNIITVKDFIGKKVGVKYGLDTEIIYNALLKKEGIDREKIEETPVQFDMGLFFTDAVDVWPGFSNVEPVVAEIQNVNINIISPLDYDIPMYAQVLVVNDKTINEKPEIIEKFIKATKKGWLYAIEHPNEMPSLVAKYSTESNDKFERLSFQETQKIVGDKGKIGEMNSVDWEILTNILKEQGIVSSDFKVENSYQLGFVT